MLSLSLSPTLLGLNAIINQVQNTFESRQSYQQSANMFPSLDSSGSATPTQWLHLECQQNPTSSKLGSVKKVMKKIAYSMQGPRLMHKLVDYWEVSCQLSTLQTYLSAHCGGAHFHRHVNSWLYSWNKEKMAWTKLLLKWHKKVDVIIIDEWKKCTSSAYF